MNNSKNYKKIMGANSIKRAINEFSRIVGSENIIINPNLRSVSGEKRKIPAIIFPKDEEEVKNIVNVANEFKTPIYPVSTGKNWGLGSALPVEDGCIIVNLQKMKKIEEVNIKNAYAVIEPGVTQWDLYEYLKKNDIPLIMDVTGSGKDSSIIGNALERGVGYFGQRGEDICGLKVVLGNGKVIETGFGHYQNSKTKYIYPYGIGPDLTGVFFQSNFGIVVKGGINLIPKSDEYVTFVTKIKNEKDLPEYIERLKEIKKNGLVKGVVHIGNRERSKISISPLIFENLEKTYPQADKKYLRELTEKLFNDEFYGDWSATGRIYGPKKHVAEAEKQIKKASKCLGSTMFLNDKFINYADKITNLFSFIPYVKKKQIILNASKPIYNFTKGIPNDAAVKSVYWPIMNPPDVLDPDNSECGIIYYCPVTPFDGNEVEKVISIIKQIFNKYGFEPSITLNTLDYKALETVISIPFKRDEETIENAHKAIIELHKNLTSIGIYPYRASIDLMEYITDPTDDFWQTVKAMKNVFDPNNIISPRRYNLI